MTYQNVSSSTSAVARATRNAAAIAIATLLARGLQFSWIVLLASLIGAEQYGVWGTIGALLAIAATVPEFGMGLVVLRDVARQPSDAGRYLTATLAVQPLLALCTHAALILLSLALPYDADFRLLLALAALSLTVDVFGNIGHNQLLAAERMVTTSVITVVHISLQIVFSLAALLSGSGLVGVYLATISAGACRSAMYGVAAWRAGILPRLPIDRALVQRLFSEGWSIALGSFLGYAYQHADRVLVFTFLGERAAGYLTAAFVIASGVIELFSVTVFTAVFPLMARLAKESPAELRRAADQFAFLTLVISLPVVIGIAALSSVLAALLFPSFSGTAGALEILIWHTVLAMVSNPYAQMLLVEEQQRLLLAVRALGLTVSLAANVILLPRLGILGAGAATFVAHTAMLAMFLRARAMTSDERHTLLVKTLRVLLAGALMGAVAFALRASQPILAMLLSLSVYGVALIGLRALDSAHWALIRQVLSALPFFGKRLARLWQPINVP
ncbi:MAG: oligosaccharide flippase family protein [Anaerolineae bacterium]|nr:oligosaccharide flippase family protein [Anaerolineae bacterium]